MFLSDKVDLSGKPTLSADKMDFSLINPVHIRKPILSVHPDKVRSTSQMTAFLVDGKLITDK